MQYTMKAGVLYQGDSQIALAKIKSVLIGSQKKIYKVTGELLSETSIRYLDESKASAGDDAEDVRLGSVIGDRREEIIDARSAMIMNSPFIAHNSRLHAQHIVSLGLLPSLYVALELELLRLEPVAGVILVAYCHRHDVQLLKALSDRAFAAHSHHLDN